MRKNKGITLIALIITIIILIILTAITLNNVIGTDLIGFATKAAENYMDAEREEEEKISELISKREDAVPSTSTPSTPPEETGGTGSSEVANGLKEYQGKYVDIGLDTNGDSTVNDWEIFYATGDRIFLISTDYVPVTKLTEWGVIGDGTILDTNGFKKSHYDSYKYGVYWPDSQTTFLELPAKPDNFLDLVMHTQYSLTDNQSHTNAMAVSHLLNTTAWNGIKTAAAESASIDFVIGSPTLEMWCKAWEKATDEDRDKFVALEAGSLTSGNGYYVKANGISAAELSVTGGQSSIPVEDKLAEVKTFFPHSKGSENCTSYWLASPCALSESSLMCVWCRRQREL